MKSPHTADGRIEWVNFLSSFNLFSLSLFLMFVTSCSILKLSVSYNGYFTPRKELIFILKPVSKVTLVNSVSFLVSSSLIACFLLINPVFYLLILFPINLSCSYLLILFYNHYSCFLFINPVSYPLILFLSLNPVFYSLILFSIY